MSPPRRHCGLEDSRPLRVSCGSVLVEFDTGDGLRTALAATAMIAIVGTLLALRSGRSADV
ncbi:hypothetical protein [Saccharopolyspora shandongensis]|uniref:hypothetical protein n=1 Tax=Saccharopolyspora shandongensis TaxID=418495 RepID=UPI0033D382EA